LWAGYGYLLVKSDTGGKTGNCTPLNLIPVLDTIPYTMPPQQDSVGSLRMIVSSFTTSSVLVNLTDSIYCEPFIAWFAWKDTCPGVKTFFFDSTYIGATKWKWNFGDQSSGTSDTSTSRNPTHIFAKPGKYKVMLVATNGIDIDSVTRLVHMWLRPFLSIGILRYVPETA
jgi:hypothetical protein